MSAFKRHVFSGSRFIFWGVVPLALLLTISLNVAATGPWTPSRLAAYVVLDAAVVLLSLGLYDPSRFRWAVRALAAIIFTVYVTYTFSTIAERKNLMRSLVGLLVIGVPALIYAIKGRFSLRENWDDFPVRLANSNDTSVLREPMNAVLNDSGVPEFVTAVAALTAAELVAAMRGGPVDLLPPEIQAWPAGHAHLCTPELRDLAQRAVERVATQSELQEAWGEEDGAVFQQKIRKLQNDLRGT